MTLAATDTTANSLGRVLYLLALYPEAQARLREEIVEAGHDAELPYDDLMQLPYLDSVVRETLRL